MTRRRVTSWGRRVLSQMASPPKLLHFFSGNYQRKAGTSMIRQSLTCYFSSLLSSLYSLLSSSLLSSLYSLLSPWGKTTWGLYTKHMQLYKSTGCVFYIWRLRCSHHHQIKSLCSGEAFCTIGVLTSRQWPKIK